MKRLQRSERSKVKEEVSKEDEPSSSFSFNPLYPSSLDREHRAYAETLCKAIEDKRVKNVALTGNYGAGKSSILNIFEEENKGRVIHVSFSSLGAKIEEKIIDIEDTSDDKTGAIRNISNLIQKEIVKQILFKESPEKLPHSKFRRISKTYIRNIYFPSMFVASVGLLIIFSFDFLRRLSALVNDNLFYFIVSLIIILLTLTLSIVVSSVLIGSSIKIEKITGGPLTLGLTGNNSYFDEYLDEILYFFEATDYDIVLIEDIDRFKKLYIFESLRQLNAIINGSKQVGKPVRFVYALKDSIFVDEFEPKNSTESVNLGLPDSLEQATNRTKFFDLIIPIVPFLAHSTSFNYINDELNRQKLSVKSAVIKIVSPTLTDMRLIKNICNEFSIFNQKVLVESSIESLKPENMFALTVYKNLFLKDFEDIKTGNSILNTVLHNSREFTQRKMSDLNIQLEDLKVARQRAFDLEDRASSYGAKLIAHLDGVAEALSSNTSSYEYGGRTVEREHFSQPSFWQEIAEAADSTAIMLKLQNPRTLARFSYSLTKSKLEALVIDMPISIEGWKKQDVERLSRQLNEIKREIAKVQTSDIAGLMDEYSSFKEDVRDTVNNEMVFNLLEAGYIDRYFTLYTSTYHTGNMSGQAMNFMIHNVDTHAMDLHYHFAGKADVENILRELGDSQLTNIALINIEILDHLLSFKDSPRMRILAESISNQKNMEEIIDVYFRNGAYPTKLIECIAPISSSIFDYVLTTKAVKNTDRWELVNRAIASMRLDIDYDLSDTTTSKLSKNIQLIQAIQSKDKKVVDNFIYLVKLAGLKLPNIAKFSSIARLAARKEEVYEVNENNLKILLKPLDHLSLDNIKSVDEEIYQYVLTQMDSYVKILDPEKSNYSITDKDAAASVLTEVSKLSKDVISKVIEAVDLSNVFIDDVTALPKNIWDPSFANVIVNTTLSNVMEFYKYKHPENNGDLDETLGTYLESANGWLNIDRESLAEYNQADLKALILSSLNSPFLSKGTKSKLLIDCFKGTLEVGSLRIDTSTPISVLLESNAINDDASTFNVVKSSAWAVVEEFLSSSTNFESYIDEVDLSAELFGMIVGSEKVNRSLKSYILKNLEKFERLLTETSADSLLDFAIRGVWRLSIEHQIILFNKTQSQAKRTKIFTLSKKNITTTEDATTLLSHMTEPYLRLSIKGARPKIEDNEDNRNLVNILRTLNMVGKTVEDKKTGFLQVCMKRKW